MRTKSIMKRETDSKSIILRLTILLVVGAAFPVLTFTQNDAARHSYAAENALRADDKPSADEVKTMLEEKFTSIYEDHFFGEKNKVEFEWLAPVQLGGQETKGRIPVKCWAAKIDVRVTFTKKSSGETGSVRRGINGNPVKEGFCIYKDAYDDWTYLTYAP